MATVCRFSVVILPDLLAAFNIWPVVFAALSCAVSILALAMALAALSTLFFITVPAFCQLLFLPQIQELWQ